jgi:hypothetical protein
MADVPVVSGGATGADPARRAPTGATGRRGLILWGPVVAYCALIFALSSISRVPALPGGMSDKTAHALLYSGLGFLVARALSGGAARPMRLGVPVAVVAFSALYGLSDECHQLFVPLRQFDLLDLASDVAGGAAGTAAWWAWGILWRLRDVV